MLVPLLTVGWSIGSDAAHQLLVIQVRVGLQQSPFQSLSRAVPPLHLSFHCFLPRDPPPKLPCGAGERSHPTRCLAIVKPGNLPSLCPVGKLFSTNLCLLDTNPLTTLPNAKYRLSSGVALQAQRLRWRMSLLLHFEAAQVKTATNCCLLFSPDSGYFFKYATVETVFVTLPYASPAPPPSSRPSPASSCSRGRGKRLRVRAVREILGRCNPAGYLRIHCNVAGPCGDGVRGSENDWGQGDLHRQGTTACAVYMF